MKLNPRELKRRALMETKWRPVGLNGRSANRIEFINLVEWCRNGVISTSGDDISSRWSVELLTAAYGRLLICMLHMSCPEGRKAGRSCWRKLLLSNIQRRGNIGGRIAAGLMDRSQRCSTYDNLPSVPSTVRIISSQSSASQQAIGRSSTPPILHF